MFWEKQSGFQTLPSLCVEKEKVCTAQYNYEMITVRFTASTDSVKEISLTINQVVVICTTVTFIVAMVSGCASGALLTYWIMRKKTVFSPAAEGQGPTVPAVPVYEEVSPKEDIEMNTNQAYGPCSVNL